MKRVEWIWILALFLQIHAGYSQLAEHKLYKRKVLFILDGSGSMKEKWRGEPKWDIAIQTLSELMDSFYHTEDNLYFGVRVLGHQYPKAMNHCQDTKLELDFKADHQKNEVHQFLKQLTPQGNTCLAYTLQSTEGDFDKLDYSQNTIILITDGLETCGGDPCAVSAWLKEKNITVSPYIIGLGIDQTKKPLLDCIGHFVDVKNKEEIFTAVETILKKTLRKTTAEVNFIDKNHYPTVTNIPFSLVDSKTGKELYHFVHSFNANKGKDTLFLNPQYTYDLIVYTTPPLLQKNIVLREGQHNVLNQKTLFGFLEDETYTQRKVRMVYRDSCNELVTHMMNFSQEAILENNANHFEYYSIPVAIQKDIAVRSGEKASFAFPTQSTLKIKCQFPGQASIYDNQWQLIKELNTQKPINMDLTIGVYHILYKKNGMHSQQTKEFTIEIKENQISELIL